MTSYRSIVCVPGFASSRLTMTRDVGKDVMWIDLWNMTARRSEAASPPTEAEYAELVQRHSIDPATDPAAPEMVELVSFVSNWWINHMVLDPANNWGPMPGIAPLALMTGLSGIDYLDPHGPLMKKSTDVWATLVQNLRAAGVPQNQIIGAPYDWRLLPTAMDIQTITGAIQGEAERTGTPVVVAGHSLGNRVIDYITRAKGAAWCQANIHAWVSIGAPWLGAGKALRSLLTGDDLGTTKFGIGLIDTTLGRRLSRAFGSTPWMMPIASQAGGYQEFNIPGDGFVFTGGPASQPMTNDVALAASGAQVTNDLITTHYGEAEMPTFTGSSFGSRLHDAPPVSRLCAVYGTGLNTEQSYFMTQGQSGLALTSAYDGTENGYVTKGGIRYETKGTLQDRDNTRDSGDGTVPYGSLTQHRAWAASAPDLHVTETIVPGPGGEHLAIMQSPQLKQTLLEAATIA